jgi:niacin transporter
MTSQPLRKLTVSALFLALGVVLPLAFHLFGIAGSVFLPMHWAVILGGSFLGPLWGAVVGALCPFLNFLITGFPRFPSLILMTPEMLTYGLLAGLLTPRTGFWSWWQGIVILFPVLIGGRLIYGIAAFLFVPLLLGTNKVLVYFAGAMASGIPGALMMLLVLPLLVIRIQKAMPHIFPHENQNHPHLPRQETKKIP